MTVHLHSDGAREHDRRYVEVAKSEVIMDRIACLHDVQVEQELSITLADGRQKLFLLIIFETNRRLEQMNNSNLGIEKHYLSPLAFVYLSSTAYLLGVMLGHCFCRGGPTNRISSLGTFDLKRD